MKRLHLFWIVPGSLLLAALIGVALVAGGEGDRRSGSAGGDSAEAPQVERGRYLARIGNCAGCHTAPGGAPMAGGFALETRYGTFHTPNLTPDPATGIGDWSRADFRNAMLRGERPDGSPMYPACPYPDFTHARAEDIDAIHAWLRSLEPVENGTRDHALDFPYGLRAGLELWQWAFFEPGRLPEETDRDPAWQRGRYLVEGLGHCNACHRQRDTFGAERVARDAPGGHMHGWYAPSLNSPEEAGLQRWSQSEAAAFLRGGRASGSVMLGPMAGVVFDSLQHLEAEDAEAMATYLRSLPIARVRDDRHYVEPSEGAVKKMMARGAALYERHCADCHGESGGGTEGVVALAGNRHVTLRNPDNVVRMIRHGGFPASTATHPYPHGMPPFPQLDDPEIAALTTYIRRSWGNEAPPVSTIGLAE